MLSPVMMAWDRFITSTVPMHNIIIVTQIIIRVGFIIRVYVASFPCMIPIMIHIIYRERLYRTYQLSDISKRVSIISIFLVLFKCIKLNVSTYLLVHSYTSVALVYTSSWSKLATRLEYTDRK